MEGYLKKDNVIGSRPITVQIYHECLGLGSLAADQPPVVMAQPELKPSAAHSRQKQTTLQKIGQENYVHQTTQQFTGLFSPEESPDSSDSESQQVALPVSVPDIQPHMRPLDGHEEHDVSDETGRSVPRPVRRQEEMVPKREVKPKSRKKRKVKGETPPVDNVLATHPRPLPEAPVVAVVTPTSQNTRGRYTGKRGQTIIVKHQDMRKMKVDAVVSTTNATLCLNSGLAKDILAKAGGELQEACAAARREQGELAECSVVTTNGFKLCSEYIIHANSPVWSRADQSGRRQALEALFTVCFREAQSRGCKSVAVPGLSAGNYQSVVLY